ncbi:MAG: phosphatidylserine decarboxylase [Theionarchaea archaeon]|nr:phosphatidylserine decarboxylase [Theionarchaea archaeon]MBU7001529.1 phosphatidylserine decarboxylase [Theionarchaea archaeon]MBU7021388.1 phosphatidylserine decarboxylase [Theionarchaea archaeon]MBU7041032.1 phosphatidylserine decarboxylase [Theionarchaea archaeon]
MKKKWVIIPVIAFLIFIFQFFRDPDRDIPAEGIVSPADGKIIAIETVKAGNVPLVTKNGHEIYLEELKGLIREDCYLVAIFMGPTDIHVNRSPMEGTVKEILYVEGGYQMASKLALSNERNIVVIDDSEGKTRMIIIQIAGKFVRRIQCFVQEGDYLGKGERLGRIVLGSQVVIILPQRFEIIAQEGDRVKAGESVIALP